MLLCFLNISIILDISSFLIKEYSNLSHLTCLSQGSSEYERDEGLMEVELLDFFTFAGQRKIFIFKEKTNKMLFCFLILHCTS